LARDELMNVWADVVVRHGPNSFEFIDSYYDADADILYQGGPLLDPTTQTLRYPEVLVKGDAVATSPFVPRSSGPVVGVQWTGGGKIGTLGASGGGGALVHDDLTIDGVSGSDASESLVPGFALESGVSLGLWNTERAYRDDNGVFIDGQLGPASVHGTLYIEDLKNPGDFSLSQLKNLSGLELSGTTSLGLSLGGDAGFQWNGDSKIYVAPPVLTPDLRDE